MIKAKQGKSKYKNNFRSIIYLRRFFALIFLSSILTSGLSGSTINNLMITDLLEAKINTISTSIEIKQVSASREGLKYSSSQDNADRAVSPTIQIDASGNVGFSTTYIENPTLPEQLRYQNVEIRELRDFLKSRNSILSNEPYFSAIITTAKEYDLNPVLLFAIAGQEQSLVPESNKNALTIANNPFNVNYSWKRYNTNIVDSAQIAAETIIRLAAGCPADVDPLKWINRLYAEDQNWWYGVRTYYTLIDNSNSDG